MIKLPLSLTFFLRQEKKESYQVLIFGCGVHTFNAKLVEVFVDADNSAKGKL